MKKKIMLIALVVLLVAIIVAFLYKDKLIRLHKVNHLFDKEVIAHNFQNINEIADVSHLENSKNPLILPKASYNLPSKLSAKKSTIDVTDFLKKTQTEGLLIIHMDTIVYEWYGLGLESNEQHISWSMSKSFIGTMIGIMMDRGQLDIHDKVVKYLPDFIGTGYELTTIENLLHMSSGVAFNEDYSDYNSDINKFGRAFAIGTSFRDFSKSLKSERTPGTYNKYVSIDTQVLGFILMQVSGKNLNELLYELIWNPIGMQDSAYWVVDNEKSEMALGGLNATLRDYAKLGLLYLHGGKLNGQQIVSEEWVTQAVTPHAPHLLPNQLETSTSLFGYGYQWWTPQFPKGDFFAVGIYDQFIYVNPEKNLVITKLSADYNFKNDKQRIKANHIDFFQALAETF